jgi:hypothetical protein
LFLKKKKETEGPFKADRILDTPEVKIDQVYTNDGKPVALFSTISEEEARKIGAEGYVGSTKIGGRGQYESGRRWVTYPIYFPDNILGSTLTENTSRQITDSLKIIGTFVPDGIILEKVETQTTFPISGTASLKAKSNGSTELNGSINISK